MTGLASLTETGGFMADEFDFTVACRNIDDQCHFYGGRLAIGWERFDINSETHKKSQAGIKDALHVIGVCRYFTERYGCRFLGEAQQHTPDKADQGQLKRLGWWVPGKDDAQSAACHLLRWLDRSGELTPSQRSMLYSD